MSVTVESAAPALSTPARHELLRRFLSAYWLRPENALWMTLRSEVLSRVPLPSPVVDISCGDGLFSFLHCGGVLAHEFDVFSSVALDRNEDNPHADMFDHLADGYHPTIVSPARSRMDVGTDFKPTMLAKAAKLDLYGKLVEHDNNRTLPFAADAFQTVYCNSAYWVTEIDKFLAELGRVTRPGGRIVLQVKLDSLRVFTLRAHRSILGDRFLDLIDRGRLDCWPTLANRSTWEARFTTAGLSIVEETPFITATHAHLWDIGLRPIAPLLTKMVEALSSETRADIKREWVDLFDVLLQPFCDPAVNLFSGSSDPGEIQYVLTPRS